MCISVCQCECVIAYKTKSADSASGARRFSLRFTHAFDKEHNGRMDPEEEKFLTLARSSEKETRQLDFKQQFDPNSAVDWSNIVKDIIAMANSGGGILVFGVADDGSIAGFDKNIVLEIDSATISDKIYSYTGENFSDFKILEVKRSRAIFASILVLGSETPITFTRNGADILVKGKQRPAFVKGIIYFRHGAKSEPADTSDIRSAFNKRLNRIRKSWFEGIRKISNIGASDEIIVSKKNPALRGKPLTLSGLLKVSEQGTPVKLSHVEFEALRQEYPLEYKDVAERCKKKKTVPQRKLQAYINSCKDNQDLSINWKKIGRSLNLPFSVPDKYMYKEKVVTDF